MTEYVSNYFGHILVHLKINRKHVSVTLALHFNTHVSYHIQGMWDRPTLPGF